MNPITEIVKNNFAENKPDFKLNEENWYRLEFSASLAVGNTILDVGTGFGVLVHLLAESGKYTKLTGFDIGHLKNAYLRPDVTYIQGSVATPELGLPVSDTVFCLEVIEHLEAENNAVILNNLRNAARRRLVISVPYEEAEPLWWHDKPGGHRQRFTLEKLALLFPKAIATLLPRYAGNWVFLIEDEALNIPQFDLLPKDQFEKVLGL